MPVVGILALTHSSRSANLSRCSAEFLTHRFGAPDRLDRLPPFDSLPPAEHLYSGAVSFFRVASGPESRQDQGTLTCSWLGSVKRRDKIQHVAFLSDWELLVGYEHFVERWTLPEPVGRLPRIDPRSISTGPRLEHPHLAGLHTVEPLSTDTVALSCSSPDAVLLLDPATGEVNRELRMPKELYGQGYPLTPEMDLRRHYIDDAGQSTHINGAFASTDARRLAVSSLIPGAIGVFHLDDPGGGYQELARGYVGCHGARFDDQGRVYFADSTTGSLVVLDGQPGNMRVARRFAVDSPWLHDVQQIHGSLYAFALSEPNELRIYDIDHDRLLYRRRFVRWPVDVLYPLAWRLPWWLGNSCQALSFFPVSS